MPVYRLTLGPVLIALVVLVGWADGALEAAGAPAGLIILGVLLAVSWIGAGELAAMLRNKGVDAGAGVLGLSATLTLLAMASPTGMFGLAPGPARDLVMPTALVVVTLAAFAWHARHRRPEGAMASAAAALLSAGYLGVLPGFYLAIRAETSAWVVLGVVLVVKVCDIGAYFTGMAVGRHKLILWLSPGKTWEGLVGGCAASALAGWGGAALASGADVGLEIAGWQGALIGLALGLTGQAGDLLESLLKRDAGVKDSGRVPGFGGVLDLIDSLLPAAPVAWWLLAAAA